MRALTQEEQDEMAAHEEDERMAAEAEQRADEARWEQHRAAVLREQEEVEMQEEMEAGQQPPGKRVSIHVRVEAAEGRIVHCRSEWRE